MNSFFSENAALIIAVLGLVVTVMVQWDVIIKRFSTFSGAIDSVPIIIFKLLIVAFSGALVVTTFWIIIDFLVAGQLSLNIILYDIASGAAWGIPLALLSGFLAKNTDRAAVYGVLISLILLLLYGPENVIRASSLVTKQIYSVLVLIVVLNMGIACGYIGYRTRLFVERITTKDLNGQA